MNLNIEVNEAGMSILFDVSYLNVGNYYKFMQLRVQLYYLVHAKEIKPKKIDYQKNPKIYVEEEGLFHFYLILDEDKRSWLHV